MMRSLAQLLFPIAIGLGCAAPVTAQAVKASLSSTTLAPTSFAQWLSDLGYQPAQLAPLSFGATGCPFVDVEVSGVKLALMLDTGTSRGLVLTNAAPEIPHRVESRDEELNADGTHRGESARIRLDSVSVLGATLKDVEAGLADWKMYSSVPFNGTVGLGFFLNRRLTLDYRSGKVAASAATLPAGLDRKCYVYLDLVEPPQSQGHVLYVRAKVNGRAAIVYLDTGYNVSFIDPAFADGLERVVRPGRFKLFRKQVPLELGGHRFLLDELREDPIRRGSGFDLPVALTLGSDVLSRFVVTIDLRAKKLVLALAE